MGGVVPHLYCDFPGHAQNTKKCLRVYRPFLQLPVTFQLHTSSQTLFIKKCAVYVVYVLHRRVSMDKIMKIYFFRYNFTAVGRMFTKLGRNVLPDDTYAVSEQKFEIRKFSTFYRGIWTLSGPPVSMGRVLYRTFAGMFGHQKKDSSIFFFHKKGKGKKRTYPK